MAMNYIPHPGTTFGLNRQNLLAARDGEEIFFRVGSTYVLIGSNHAEALVRHVVAAKDASSGTIAVKKGLGKDPGTLTVKPGKGARPISTAYLSEIKDLTNMKVELQR